MGSHPLGAAGPVKVRAFFGLPLPEAHRERLDGYLSARPTLYPKFRWTRSENLHITVRFLGQVDLEVAERIAARVEADAPRGFTLQLGGIDAFKRGKLARVLWLGLKLGTAEVSELASLVENECEHEGLEPENRAFHPHVTLARARKLEGAPAPKAHSPELPPWNADELVLYRSRLGRSGPVYEALRSITLR